MGSGKEGTEKRKPDICTIVFMFVWVLTEVLLLLKCRMGYASYDETLYLTIPYRFVQGDAMIVDEWNLSQLSSFIIMPYVYAYLKIFGNTAGIYLAYRYFSTIIWGLAALFFYGRLKKYSLKGAFLASTLFLIYVPYGLMALSYNAQAILAISCAATILLPIGDEIRSWQYYPAGLLFACSVLCCPHVIVIWAAGLIYAIIKRKIKEFVVFTAGAATLAVVLMLFILSRATVAEVLQVIPVILDDPYHQQISLFGYIKGYILQIVFGIKHGPVIYGCLAVLSVCIKLDKRRSERKALYYNIACLMTAALLVEFLLFNKYINFFVFPVCVLAFVCFMLSDDIRVKRLFMHYWIPGIMYSFCINMASTQYLKAITAASSVAMIGSVIIAGMVLEEISDTETVIRMKVPAVLISVTATLLMLLPLADLRYRFVFWDNEVWESSKEISAGPMKGIVASSGKVEHYMELYEDAEGFLDYGRKTVFFMRDNWPYLLEGLSCSAYSPWLQNEIDDYTVDRLIKYYTLDSSRMPDVIYVDREYSDYAGRLIEELDYHKAETMESGNSIAIR